MRCSIAASSSEMTVLHIQTSPKVQLVTAGGWPRCKSMHLLVELRTTSSTQALQMLEFMQSSSFLLVYPSMSQLMTRCLVTLRFHFYNSLRSERMVQLGLLSWKKHLPSFMETILASLEAQRQQEFLTLMVVHMRMHTPQKCLSNNIGIGQLRGWIIMACLSLAHLAQTVASLMPWPTLARPRQSPFKEWQILLANPHLTYF